MIDRQVIVGHASRRYVYDIPLEVRIHSLIATTGHIETNHKGGEG